MSNVARKSNQPEPVYEVGVVATADGGDITVRTARGSVVTERAASCLVPPVAGDEVAVFLPGDGRAFVTAVLTRGEGEPLRIAVDGDLSIEAQGGSCRIAAAGEVDISSGGVLSLASRLLSLRADEGEMLIGSLTLIASSVLAHADGASLAARSIDWVCERLSSVAKRAFRTVEELDHLRAGRVDYRTEEEMCLRAEHFVVGARGLAKVDAEQIHIG